MFSAIRINALLVVYKQGELQTRLGALHTHARFSHDTSSVKSVRVEQQPSFKGEAPETPTLFIGSMQWAVVCGTNQRESS